MNLSALFQEKRESNLKKSNKTNELSCLLEVLFDRLVYRERQIVKYPFAYSFFPLVIEVKLVKSVIWSESFEVMSEQKLD